MNKVPADALDVDLQQLSPTDRYKILCGVVVPRPIAWVSTLNADGVVNVAPFSFFNVFSEDPPLFVLGLQHNADGSFKDTTRNIHFNGEFVVNLCDESLAEKMNETAIDFPSNVSEAQSLSLALAPSTSIDVPRIAAAPFAFECKREVSLAFGPGRELLVGQPLRVHARPGLLVEDDWHVNYDAYEPVGRLFADLYARQSDIFSMSRTSYEQYRRARADPSQE